MIFVRMAGNRMSAPIRKKNPIGMAASNTGAAGNTDEENAARLQGGIDNGSHMLCDDFPAPVDGQEYHLDLPGGTPSICNPQTAPAECTPEAIESL